jgi:hypothetical protein
MSAAEPQLDATALRALEMRTRALPLDRQMAECVDLLQAPHFVVDDLVRSVEQIREAGQPSRDLGIVTDEGAHPDAFFYPSRELFVQGDRCSFTCLATSVGFRESVGVSVDPANRIDYAAVTCESRPFPLLGFAQSCEVESAYPILLRSLSSLIELARPRRFDVMDREIYRGILGPAPAFDLVLVLWDDDVWDDDEVVDPRRPLCELSRDLAEVLKSTLKRESRFPPILNDIVCLRMNPKRFDGRLRFVWRV